MPIRIYALAKELNIENKDLVEICNKAGIHGKGSALASLSEEEVAKVRAFMGSGKQERPNAPVRRPAAAAAAPSPPQAPAAAAPAPLMSRGRTATAEQPPPVTRPAYSLLSKGKVKVLDSSSKKKTDDQSEGKRKDPAEGGGKPPGRSEPVISVAPMPEVKQPPPPKRDEGVKAQKPVMKLPKDAIRGAKEGKKAPLESLITKSEKAKKVRDREQAEPVKGPLAEKGRGRRGRGEEEVATDLGDLRRIRTEKRKRQPRSEDEPSRRIISRHRRKGPTKDTRAPRKEKVVLDLPCNVREFSQAAEIPAAQVLRILMQTGVMANINLPLDEETVAMLITELGLEVELRHEETLEDSVISAIEEREDDPDTLITRPPVITFLGHVDHGKTSLLDRIIGINVVSGEAGGITQHIRAYKIEKDGREIAFVDTPGHEAFTEMRARGANVTDIAVLVVAADDGVMPQTQEAISHARAAGVPIVVAVNKIDLPGVDENKAMQDLAANELLPSAWGGDIEVIKTSATTGQGIDDLLETLLLTADIHDYKANPNRAATGTCLEAEQETGRGVIAKLMVKSGTLHVGDVIVCGEAHGRVKAMYDTLNPTRRVDSAGPSTPVNITGFDIAPGAGESFYVLGEIAQAREIAEHREFRARAQDLSRIRPKISFDDFVNRLQEGTLHKPDERVTLNLIIRADVRGSIEAIQKELTKLVHPEIQINILQATVGGISEADVWLGHASEAVIIGFNVVPTESARSLADEKQVEIRRYDVIYKITDDVKATLEGKLKPERREVELGYALVMQVFSISRAGTIAGCRVTRGNIERNCRVRVIRAERVIGDYALESLKHHKDDVREVRAGMECGIKLAGFNDIKEADALEAYKYEEVARTL